ncbi:class I SAM-dependent methyltransferase [uncultured Sphingomonas sp.]|uniref:class I SAM-dependent methyltransferase n=1 Tax=uncultured Sphingomonas sp. TaxID=158754 RepID=UPI0030D9A5C3
MTGAQDWRGRVGETWAAEYRRTERAFSAIAQALDLTVAQHAPDKGRAVDIGCGAGSTAIALARARPDMTVTGIDLSVPLLSVAQSRAGGIPRLQFVAGDARELLPSMAPLDLLVSRHGVMFFDDPVAGFADMARAARAGAPLVFSCFRSRIENDWSGAVDRVLGQRHPPTAMRSVPMRSPTGNARIASCTTPAGTGSRRLRTTSATSSAKVTMRWRMPWPSIAGSGRRRRYWPRWTGGNGGGWKMRCAICWPHGYAAGQSRLPQRSGYGPPRRQESEWHDDHRPSLGKFAVAARPVDARGTRHALYRQAL